MYYFSVLQLIFLTLFMANSYINIMYSFVLVDPIGREVSGVGLRYLDSSDFGLEFHQGHGCPTAVCVVCSQVEVSAPG